jgi:hypothetical protein
VSAPAPRSSLARIIERWSATLGGGVARGSGPLLRIERGAPLLQGEPPVLLEEGVDSLLGEVGPLLARSPPTLGAAVVRARVRLEIESAGSGYLARVRYFGSALVGARYEAVVAASGPGFCLLPPRQEGGEVSQAVLLQPPPGDMAVVHVLAGRRPVALPLACVERALPDDARQAPSLRVRSLARCLAEEPVPAAGRSALLLLRSAGSQSALRVELLVGHGSERVLPAGPLLLGTPWLLGVVERGEEAPVPVVDPVVLVSRAQAHDGG